MFAPAMELYGMSFPYSEQREPDSQARIMSDPEYHFELIYDEGRFVGEILSWENADFIYVEHFCMLPDVRGRGCGSRALELLRARGKTIILEIDPPVDDISRRRKGFYERNGFIANDYDYTHLPYHRGCKGHRLVIMSSIGVSDRVSSIRRSGRCVAGISRPPMVSVTAVTAVPRSMDAIAG